MTAVLLTALLFVVTGWGIVGRLHRQAPASVVIAEAFLVGALMQAVVFCVLSECGVPWSRGWLFAGPGLSFGVLRFPFFVVRRRGTRTTDNGQRKTPSPGLGGVELSVIAAVTILHALFATIAPLTEWDFLGIWGMKGNVFFEHRGIDWAFLEHPEHGFTNRDYPPMLPIGYAIHALIRGVWEERFIGAFNTLFGLAAAVIACDGTSVRRLPLFQRIPAVVTLTLVAFSGRIGLAEGALIAFGIAALLRLRDHYFLLGALLLGGAAWTKNEGLALLAAVVLGMVVAGLWRRLLLLWPAVVLAGSWQLARALHELPTERARGNPFERIAAHLAQWSEWMPELWRYLEKPAFWLAMIVVFIAAGRRALWRERFMVTVLLAQLAAIAAAYLVTYVHLPLELEHSWERVTHQLALIAAATAVLAWQRRTEADQSRPS
ncbi:MAG TPA: hypothetical protein VF618_11140 [Thermoanaerobaculia bacterium]